MIPADRVQTWRDILAKKSATWRLVAGEERLKIINAYLDSAATFAGRGDVAMCQQYLDFVAEDVSMVDDRLDDLASDPLD